MKENKMRKFGFTLVEVMLVTSAFAMIVVGIVLAINRAFVFIDNTRLSVRATNFAREGMEMMYNIRDTNWRKHSGDRDVYWLSLGKEDNYSYTFAPGIYALKEVKDENGNLYFYADDITLTQAGCTLPVFYSDDGFWDSKCDSYRDDVKMKFEGTYFYYDWDETDKKLKKQEGNMQDALIGNGLEFYRIVRVFGVYKKDDDSGNSNPDKQINDDTKKKDGTPAEMRFCVKVFYRSTGKHSTELCGIMTNFME